MTFTRIAFVGLTILPILLGSPVAKAEDDADAVILPGLRAAPPSAINIAGTAITLSNGTVTLAITTSSASAAATILLQGPPFKWLGEDNAYPDRQFPELRISIDHTPAPTQDHSSATFAGADITADLNAAGIDKFSISQDVPVLFPTPQNQKLFSQLLASGAIIRLGGQDIAAWTAQRSLTFSLPKGAHLLTLTYNARPSITLRHPADLQNILPLATYCLTPRQVQRAAARAEKNGNVLAVQYAIPAGIDGRIGPTAALTLANPGGRSLPATSAFFCAPTARLTAAAGKITAPAKPDASGTIHILTLGSP